MWQRCWCSVDLNAVLSPPERDINYVSSGRKMPPRSQEHLVFLVRLTVSLSKRDYYPLFRSRLPENPFLLFHPAPLLHPGIYARLPTPLPPGSGSWQPSGP